MTVDNRPMIRIDAVSEVFGGLRAVDRCSFGDG
jgi:hypothetical protein